MLKDVPDRVEVAWSIVESLTCHTYNKLHARHIHVDECEELGLKITPIQSGRSPCPLNPTRPRPPLLLGLWIPL